MYDKEMMTIQMEKGANDDHIYICFLAQGVSRAPGQLSEAPQHAHANLYHIAIISFFAFFVFQPVDCHAG